MFKYLSGENKKLPDKTNIYDYLGFFEIAYEMKQNKQIKENDFFNIFFYRIDSFATNPEIIAIIEDEYIYWEKLVELISKSNEWGLLHKRIDRRHYSEVNKIYKRIKNKYK